MREATMREGLTLSPAPSRPEMTREEARAAVEQMRMSIDTLRRVALDFARRKGWAALGYPSLRACLESELRYSWQHGYRLIRAGEVQEEIEAFSPQGETPPLLPTKHALALSHLDSPEDRYEAWKSAGEIASTEGPETPIAERHIRLSVALVSARKTVLASPYFIVGQMMTVGDITPFVALEMVRELEKLPPRKRGYIVQLMASPGLTCPALIAPLAGMFERKSGEESKVLPEVLAAGTLGGTPLARATLSDLGRANYEASLEHASEADARPPVHDWQTKVEPVIVTVYKGNGARSVEALRRALGPAFDELHLCMLRV